MAECSEYDNYFAFQFCLSYTNKHRNLRQVAYIWLLVLEELAALRHVERLVIVAGR